MQQISKQVLVCVPTFVSQLKTGYVQINGKNPNVNIGSSIWAGPSAAKIAEQLYNGVDYSATVTTPTLPVDFGKGQLEYVQLVKPDFSYTQVTTPGDAGTIHYYPPAGDSPAPIGLDSRYPIATAAESAGEFPFGDSPYFKIYDTYVQLKLSGAFTTYLMYEPPGGTWVPLGNFDWSMDGGAHIPATGQWADYANSTAPTDSAGTVSSTSTGFNPSTAFPVWTKIYTFQNF